jgi:hypothetical protein
MPKVLNDVLEGSRMSSTRDEMGLQSEPGIVPNVYDIVWRGRLPGISFHNNMVELLYQS